MYNYNMAALIIQLLKIFNILKNIMSEINKLLRYTFTLELIMHRVKLFM